ncbi:arsenate reductase [Balnearium lithotrophicum]|uniref:Arsenate reductase n=1 Tax=Balnearium lithotrophicum TaxID=223788 RepID=A0A521DB30_9BACT|nr:arsenate reductase ArsC [Balnearium lithotrophicum]SMO68080.1 arsenate reductase [Balnearium lithotrophicum]
MKIGFICTGNSARSQMAEGFAKYYAKKLGKNVEVYSAGSSPAGYVHPLAVEVMREIGIDISKQKSKSLEEIPLNKLDLTVTLCGDAAENCPIVPRANVQHWRLFDPVRVEGTIEEKLKAFREVRNEVIKRVKKLIESL